MSIPKPGSWIKKTVEEESKEVVSRKPNNSNKRKTEFKKPYSNSKKARIGKDKNKKPQIKNKKPYAPKERRPYVLKERERIIHPFRDDPNLKLLRDRLMSEKTD